MLPTTTPDAAMKRASDSCSMSGKASERCRAGNLCRADEIYLMPAWVNIQGKGCTGSPLLWGSRIASTHKTVHTAPGDQRPAAAQGRRCPPSGQPAGQSQLPAGQSLLGLPPLPMQERSGQTPGREAGGRRQMLQPVRQNISTESAMQNISAQSTTHASWAQMLTGFVYGSQQARKQQRC